MRLILKTSTVGSLSLSPPPHHPPCPHWVLTKIFLLMASFKQILRGNILSRDFLMFQKAEVAQIAREGYEMYKRSYFPRRPFSGKALLDYWIVSSLSCSVLELSVPSASHLPSEGVSCDFKGSLLSDAGHYFGGTITFGFNKKVIN